MATLRNGLPLDRGFNPKTRHTLPDAASGWDQDPLPWDAKALRSRVAAIKNARTMKARDLWRRKTYA